MIFVTSDRNRARLENLTRLLVETFPGSTVYQHVDPMRAPRDALHNKVAGVFLEAEMDEVSGIELMQMLHRQKADLPVFILSQTELLRKAAMDAGAAGYVLHPVSEQALRDAVLSAKHRENEP